MDEEFPFVVVPDHLRPIVGNPDKGTRMYRAYGSEAEFKRWIDAVMEIDPSGNVSPGGVSMYVEVSRAGVHKRMKEGRLSAFLFHVIEKTTRFGSREVLRSGGRPYVDIPLSECFAWHEQLQKLPKAKQREEARGDGDYYGGELLDREGRKIPRKKPKK